MTTLKETTSEYALTVCELIEDLVRDGCTVEIQAAEVAEWRYMDFIVTVRRGEWVWVGNDTDLWQALSIASEQVPVEAQP